MFEFEHAGLTDVGMKRTHNEDNLYIFPERHLFLVADGMGGHASGEVASQIAIETVAQFFMDQKEDEDLTWPYKANKAYDFEGNLLVNAIRYANYCVYDKASQGSQYKGMGTTFVAMLFHEGRYYVGHVGDSRAYRVRDGEVVQLTEDHSLLNDYKKMAKLTPEEEKNFPHKNIIVRALGMKETVLVDLGVDDAQPGDLFLLCSDGLSGEIDDPGLLELALDHWDDPEAMVQAMVDTANNNGGKDNVTVVVVKVV